MPRNHNSTDTTSEPAAHAAHADLVTGHPSPHDDLADPPDAHIGPFVAWLATQDLDEPTRRAHREAVEAFLRWNHSEHGADIDRRRHYDQILAASDPDQAAAARAGLKRFADYRALVAITLPPNH